MDPISSTELLYRAGGGSGLTKSNRISGKPRLKVSQNFHGRNSDARLKATFAGSIRSKGDAEKIAAARISDLQDFQAWGVQPEHKEWVADRIVKGAAHGINLSSKDRPDPTLFGTLVKQTLDPSDPWTTRLRTYPGNGNGAGSAARLLTSPLSPSLFAVTRSDTRRRGMDGLWAAAEARPPPPAFIRPKIGLRKMQAGWIAQIVSVLCVQQWQLKFQARKANPPWDRHLNNSNWRNILLRVRVIQHWKQCMKERAEIRTEQLKIWSACRNGQISIRLLVHIRIWRKQIAARVLKKFMTDPRVNACARMRIFHQCCRKAGDVCRSFVHCRRARLKTLAMMWDQILLTDEALFSSARGPAARAKARPRKLPGLKSTKIIPALKDSLANGKDTRMKAVALGHWVVKYTTKFDPGKLGKSGSKKASARNEAAEFSQIYHNIQQQIQTQKRRVYLDIQCVAISTFLTKKRRFHANLPMELVGERVIFTPEDVKAMMGSQGSSQASRLIRRKLDENSPDYHPHSLKRKFMAIYTVHRAEFVQVVQRAHAAAVRAMRDIDQGVVHTKGSSHAAGQAATEPEQHAGEEAAGVRPGSALARLARTGTRRKRTSEYIRHVGDGTEMHTGGLAGGRVHDGDGASPSPASRRGTC
jgi:hypothetical protein